MFASQAAPDETSSKRTGNPLHTAVLAEAGHFVFVDPQSDVWPQVLASVRVCYLCLRNSATAVPVKQPVVKVWRCTETARRPAGQARRPSIPGVFERGATQPAGMHRRRMQPDLHHELPKPLE